MFVIPVLVRLETNKTVRAVPGTPNDRFLSNAFKLCFRLSGVLLKLCRLILGCVKKHFICSVILGELLLGSVMEAVWPSGLGRWCCNPEVPGSRPPLCH